MAGTTTVSSDAGFSSPFAVGLDVSHEACDGSRVSSARNIGKSVVAEESAISRLDVGGETSGAGLALGAIEGADGKGSPTYVSSSKERVS
jgi:hypothetical protein